MKQAALTMIQEIVWYFEFLKLIWSTVLDTVLYYFEALHTSILCDKTKLMGLFLLALYEQFTLKGARETCAT